MSRKLLTEEEINTLKNNKYVTSVSEKNITYTKECREDYINLISSGLSKKKAFMQLGFDPIVLGNERIKAFHKRVKRNIKNNITMEDKRIESNKNKKKHKKSTLTEKEELEYLRHENIMLKAENELLKKMAFWEKQ